MPFITPSGTSLPLEAGLGAGPWACEPGDEQAASFQDRQRSTSGPWLRSESPAQLHGWDLQQKIQQRSRDKQGRFLTHLCLNLVQKSLHSGDLHQLGSWQLGYVFSPGFTCLQVFWFFKS